MSNPSRQPASRQNTEDSADVLAAIRRIIAEGEAGIATDLAAKHADFPDDDAEALARRHGDTAALARRMAQSGAALRANRLLKQQPERTSPVTASKRPRLVADPYNPARRSGSASIVAQRCPETVAVRPEGTADSYVGGVRTLSDSPERTNDDLREVSTTDTVSSRDVSDLRAMQMIEGAQAAPDFERKASAAVPVPAAVEDDPFEQIYAAQPEPNTLSLSAPRGLTIPSYQAEASNRLIAHDDRAPEVERDTPDPTQSSANTAVEKEASGSSIGAANLPSDADDDLINEAENEATVREVIRELIQEELHGELGQRFSRNLRAIIRREVAAAIDEHLERL